MNAYINATHFEEDHFEHDVGWCVLLCLYWLGFLCGISNGISTANILSSYNFSDSVDWRARNDFQTRPEVADIHVVVR